VDDTARHNDIFPSRKYILRRVVTASSGILACTGIGAIMQKQLTAIIERENDGYVSLCPELDIASQGGSIEEARENLREAVELFFEAASPEEIQQRLHEEVYVTRLEVAVG
jgi:predicted RNase H-like HicB family nuclease